MLPAAEEVAQEGRATGHYPHSPALLEDSVCRPRNPIPSEPRRPSPFCHAPDGERASLPAFPTAGPSSHRVSDTPRSLSTNSAGLQGVSRRGCTKGRFAHCALPVLEWIGPSRDEPGNPNCNLLPSGVERQTAAFDGKSKNGSNSAPCRLNPPARVSDCVPASETNLKVGGPSPES
jgi:hypothetical protein